MNYIKLASIKWCCVGLARIVLALAIGGDLLAGEKAIKRNDSEVMALALDNMHKLGRYKGASIAGVDRKTLNNKVVVGYQGWHNAEGDGAGNGWRHYELKGAFRPGSTCIDFWPDMSEFTEGEKYKTAFNYKDGSPAYVFSAYNSKTVMRHFEWMRDYRIDAAFLQRFGNSVVRNGTVLNHCNTVLANVRAGANMTGRAYAVMYDLSGLAADSLETMKEDWRRLVKIMGITRDENDKAYLHHRGKPLVAVWGVGFSTRPNDSPDKRAFGFPKQKAFIEFLQKDPEAGGCSVMLGIPTAWRTLSRDSISDPEFLEFIKTAEVISPWTPGRYCNEEGVAKHSNDYWKGDYEWAQKNSVDYLPVVFPGFSWHNKTPDSDLNQIPRSGGRFLWSQFAELKKVGVKSVYVAMFDEIDEGTQIFKTTANPPVGESPFCWYGMDEGIPLPSDHYLWLVAEAGKMIRGQQGLRGTMPAR